MSMQNFPEFDVALKTFVAACQRRLDEHFEKHYPTQTAPVVETSKGRRYVRVIKNDSVQRSVHCFVDTTNGDVLKADGWKGPAKGARGNIFSDDNGMEGVGVWGAAYLR